MVLCASPADVVADANGQPAGVAPQPLGSPGSAPSEASELVDPLSEAAGVQLSRRNSFEVSRLVCCACRMCTGNSAAAYEVCTVKDPAAACRVWGVAAASEL